MKSKKAFPYLKTAEIEASVEELRTAYKEQNRGELFSPKMDEILKAFVHEGAHILDLGSSNGRIFSIIDRLQITPHTYGADIADYLSVGKPRESFKTFNFSTDTFPYDDNTFDVITNIEVIEHLENPYHFLREVARILKPGGRLILSTPNPLHIYNRLSFLLRGKFYRFLDGNDHIMLFAHYVLTKGALRFFTLEATQYMFGEMPYRIFSKFTYPENSLFGRTVFYIFKKK